MSYIFKVDHSFYEKQNINISFKNIQSTEDIIIFDFTEVQNFYPYDDIDVDVFGIFYKLHKKLQNHKAKVFYICSDLNSKHRYDKFNDIVKNNKKFEIINYPFFNLPEFVDIDISSIKKNKNFCLLSYEPKIIRLMILDFFYENSNFLYSCAPFYKSRNTFSKLYAPSYPYRWDVKKEKIQIFDQYGNNRFVHTINSSISDKIIFPNGFYLPENSKKLDKLDNKCFYDKIIPDSNLMTCCDLILESYVTGDSIFFTEKTWKSILHERPFLLFGSKKQNNTLNYLGFELYEELFDYSFDLFDGNKKLFSFIDQVEKYLNLDSNFFNYEIHNNIKEKILFNKNIILNLYKLNYYNNILDFVINLKPFEIQKISKKNSNSIINFFIGKHIDV